jgi:hypothetical protein
MTDQTKVCTGCRFEYRATARKPLTAYFWRQSREPDGLRKRCKMCCRELPCMANRIAKDLEQLRHAKRKGPKRAGEIGHGG